MKRDKLFNLLSGITSAVAEGLLPEKMATIATVAINVGINELDKATDGKNADGSPVKKSILPDNDSTTDLSPGEIHRDVRVYQTTTDSKTGDLRIKLGGKSEFKFGPRSIENRKGVHPDLLRIVDLALTYSEQDFGIFEGGRSDERQEQLVATGMSQTRDSYHKKQKSGFFHAVDLVPWINGAYKWDWDGCFKIACAMDRAAAELGLDHLLTWGAVWDYPMSLYGNNSGQDIKGIKAAVEFYKDRHPGKDFLDGPHYQFAR